MFAARMLPRCYAAVVRLYPRDYRLEFAGEMQVVFADAVAEAISDGRKALLVVCMRELRDCPKSLFTQHWLKMRRRFSGKDKRHVDELVPTPGIVPEHAGALAYALGPLGRNDLAAGRLFDLAFAAFWLLLTAPLLVLIAAMIKLDSRGPVFFLQQRVGRDGCRFTMYKFRTMAIACDKILPNDGRCDRRVTRVGRVIRKFNLDEVPQLCNVLKGDMRILGPRPELP